MSNNTTLSASVVGRDENIDLALLKINQTGLIKSVLGDSDAVKQGDEIFTLGYPFGIKGDVSFKEGTISRTLTSGDNEYLEISADIHPGNSGGPLVNRYGIVVGINTAVFGENIQGVSVGETIKLAIPVNIAKSILTDLKNGRNIVNNITQNENSEQENNIQNEEKQKQYENYLNFTENVKKILKALGGDFVTNFEGIVKNASDNNFSIARTATENEKKIINNQKLSILDLKLSEPYIDQEDTIKYSLNITADICDRMLNNLLYFINNFEEGLNKSNKGLSDVGLDYLEIANNSDPIRVKYIKAIEGVLIDITSDADKRFK